MMNVMASPPRLQLKQWNRFFPGLTEKEPVRSSWNGQTPIRVEPFLDSLTYGSNTSSMESSLTLLIVDSLIITWSGVSNSQLWTGRSILAGWHYRD